jgi:hypothetical protein
MSPAGGRKETVPIVTLDSLSLPDPQFVKCDVEGHEIDVLCGAEQLIRRAHPVWFMEGHSETVFEFMRKHDYSTSYCRDDAWVPYDGTRATNYLYR